MKRNKAIASMDVALVCLLGLFLFLFVFLSFQSANGAELSLVFCAEVLILLAVHFRRSLVLGLGLSGGLVLAYGGYTLYFCLVDGLPPPARLYFFVLWAPLVTFVFWLFLRRSHALSLDNARMREDLDTLNNIDELTGFYNMRGYVTVAPVYMGLARRYSLGLGLVIVRVEDFFCADGLGMENLKNTIKALEQTLRVEDEVFLVSKEPFVFALTMLTQKTEDCAVVFERLRSVKIPWNLALTFDWYPYNGEESASLLLEHALSNTPAEIPYEETEEENV